MVLLIISLIFTMMARSITTAFMPRSMMFSTMGSKASVHRFVSTTPEVSYRRKAVNRGWTLTQKMATLGKDIWVLQFDGGSRGNPGRAGSGSVIYKSTLGGDKRTEKCVLHDSEEMWNGYHYLGESVTNNVAEYSGLIEGLKQAVSMNIPSLLIQGDSQLILYQVEGKYKVKNENLRVLHTEATELLRSIPKFILEYIPRARNARADELSNFAMNTLQNTSTLVAGTTTASASPSNILSDVVSIPLLENVPNDIESAVESPSIPMTGTEDPESLSSVSKGPESVDGECREQDGLDDSDHLEGDADISLERKVRVTVPESDIVHNDDQTVTVTIAISQLKSLLAMDASEDAPSSVQTAATNGEEIREDAIPKVRKSAARKITDPLVKKATKKVAVKKTDKESIIVSVKSSSEKTRKTPKTESKKIEISL